MNMMVRYDAIVFDIDSTLVTIEGIDELARKKGVYEEVSRLTAAAMEGRCALEDVFFKRLARIAPTTSDLVALGELYCRHLTPGTETLFHTLMTQAVPLFLVSSGYHPAADMLARRLGIHGSRVFANELLFDKEGQYRGVNKAIPLWREDGKRQIVRAVRKQTGNNLVVIGDGISDWEAGEEAGAFVCFAGVAARPEVMKRSRSVITRPSLEEVLAYLTEAAGPAYTFG